MKVYIVQGSAGMYDDHTEWPVCAYLKEDDAKNHSTAADDWIKNNGVKINELRDKVYQNVRGEMLNKKISLEEALNTRLKSLGLINPYDPDTYVYHPQDTGYGYYSIDLKDNFDVQ